MTALSKERVLFYDISGLYTYIAEAMSPDVGAVQYYSEWKLASKDAMPGVGLEGVERVNDFFTALDHCTCVVFPYVGQVGLQEWLKRQGYPVWGAGLGSRLEQDRWALKTVLKECGLPVGESVVIRGVDDLREHLKEVDDCYIKFSFFRADCETFHHESYFKSQTWLDYLSLQLGAFGQIAEFIIEEPIDADESVEAGIDLWMVNGEIVPNPCWGYECKDAFFLLSTAGVPERLMSEFKKLQPVLREIAYTGPLSTESRCTEDADYIIDITARFPSPPSEIQAINTENLAEIICEGANGRIVTPRYKKPYAAQFVLKSAWGKDHDLGLKIGRPDRVCVHGHYRIEEKDYAVSPLQYEECGGAVGLGDSLEEAIADAFDAADSVSGYEVKYDASAASKALECVRKGEALDLVWGLLEDDTKAA